MELRPFSRLVNRSRAQVVAGRCHLPWLVDAQRKPPICCAASTDVYRSLAPTDSMVTVQRLAGR